VATQCSCQANHWSWVSPISGSHNLPWACTPIPSILGEWSRLWFYKLRTRFLRNCQCTRRLVLREQHIWMLNEEVLWVLSFERDPGWVHAVARKFQNFVYWNYPPSEWAICTWYMWMNSIVSSFDYKECGVFGSVKCAFESIVLEIAHSFEE